MAVTVDESPFGASTSKRFGAGDRQTGKIRSLACTSTGGRWVLALACWEEGEARAMAAQLG